MAIGNAPPDPIDLARETSFTLGPITVSPSTLEAIIGERREIIEPRIMQVWVALMRRRGEVVSRDELIAQCWEGRAVGDDAITRCIARLRRLSEAEGGFTIETIPRVGYRLSEAQLAEPVTAAPVLWWSRRRLPLIGGSLVVLFAAAFVGASFLHAALEPAGPQDRVAVLSFKPLSSDKDVAFFCDALAGQIVAVLNDNEVQAVSRTGSIELRKTDREATARRLGVGFVVDGKVQRTPSGLRVTAHLDHVATNTTVWSASFDQTGEGSVGLQSQVAARVVDEIKGALQAAGHMDDAALVAFLKAKELSRESGRTPTILRRDQMRIVVAHAPDFSPGQSGLAISSVLLMRYAPDRERDGLRAEAEQAIARALALNPRNGEAYLAKAGLAADQDYAVQEALFRKGLAVDPSEPTLNSTLAALLENVGRNTEALSLHERAVMLDPLSPRKNAGLASAQVVVGNHAEARATAERASQLWPTNVNVWINRLYVLLSSGLDDEARLMLRSQPNVSGTLEPDFFAAVTAFEDAMQTKTPPARAAAKQAILAAVAHRHFPDSGALELLARLGDTEAAFAMAERIVSAPPEHGKRPETVTLFRPATAALRRDPRFLPLVNRIGLIQYWKAQGAPDFCAKEDVPVCRALKPA